MTTPARIVRVIGILGMLGWLGMVGWVAKASLAQNGAQDPAPALPTVTGGAVSSKKEDGGPPPIDTPVALGATKEPGASAPPPPIDSLPEQAEKLPSAPEPIARAAAGVPAESRHAEPDDPERSADSFVERSQKEAEEHLRSLASEAEQLRNRLAKLDAGIRKWQGLLSALKSAQQGQTVAAGGEEAANLEPIGAGAVLAPRNDKRVKWASTTAVPGNSSDALPVPTAEPAAAPAAPATQPAPAAAPAQTTIPPQVVVPAATPR